MQVQVNESIQKPAFKPVAVVLNFDNKEDFEMFFQTMGFNESIPKLLTSAGYSSPKEAELARERCSELLTQVHAAMRDYRYNN